MSTQSTADSNTRLPTCVWQLRQPEFLLSLQEARCDAPGVSNFRGQAEALLAEGPFQGHAAAAGTHTRRFQHRPQQVLRCHDSRYRGW